MFLLFIFLSNVYLISCQTAGQVLYCNRIYGNFNEMTVKLGRALQDGDSITWNGTVGGASSIRHTFTYAPPAPQIPFHMRQDLPNQRTIFNTLSGKWGGEVFGPPIYQIGQPYQITVKLAGSQFQIYRNGNYVYSFPMRMSGAGIMSVWNQGSPNMNWMEMTCVNSPFTTMRSTTRRRRRGHGHGGNGHGHGNGHGGNYNSDSSDGSSSSDESCDN